MRLMESYQDEVKILKKKYLLEPDNESIADTLKYHLSAASKHFYMPEYLKDPLTFHKELLYYRGLAVLDDLYNEEVWGQVLVHGNLAISGELKSKPLIYCTYHLGSYRMLNVFLVRNQINHSIVIDGTTIKNQSKRFFDLHDKFKDVKDFIHKFKILNAEDSSIGIQMIRDLKSGQSLLFYIDGNSGVGGMGRNDEKLANIKFLGRDIYARKGVAFISHFTRTPIVPVISYRSPEGIINIKFFDAIYPNLNQEREAYSNETTQVIFDLFSAYLQKYPEQWEGWLYAHKFINKNMMPPAQSLKINELLNNPRVTFFSQNGETMLFDRDTFHCYKAPKQILDLFAKNINIVQ